MGVDEGEGDDVADVAGPAGDRTPPLGLTPIRPDLRLISLYVYADVYPKEVVCTVMAYDERGPVGKRGKHTVARHRFARSRMDDDAWAVASVALSWYVDQLDLTGGWELPS
jgi:hypothetical protein